MILIIKTLVLESAVGLNAEDVHIYTVWDRLKATFRNATL